MANLYYTHQSVKNPQEASIFADEYTWTILDVLRKAGSKGMASQSVHKEVEKKMHTSISRSKIYGLLRRMWQMNWVHRYYNKDSQAQHSIVKIDWGTFLVDKDYDHVIVSKEKDYMSRKLFPVFLDFIKKTTEDLNKDSSTTKWLPWSNDYCKFCNKSHEAEEFFNSILDIASAEFLDSNEYLEFLKGGHFADNNGQ